MQPSASLDWYVVKVQTNREGTIKSAIERRIKRDGFAESFGRIIIPTEKLVDNRSGKKVIKERKLFPGYLFIEMVMSDECWYLVRDISGVGDFTGSAGKPHTMSSLEVDRMLGTELAAAAPTKCFSIDFVPGDTVKVTAGAFDAFDGVVDSIDENSGKITVLIEIFGRPTPVEFEYHELERP